jgi:hypothetical protein
MGEKPPVSNVLHDSTMADRQRFRVLLGLIASPEHRLVPTRSATHGGPAALRLGEEHERLRAFAALLCFEYKTTAFVQVDKPCTAKSQANLIIDMPDDLARSLEGIEAAQHISVEHSPASSSVLLWKQALIFRREPQLQS